MGAQPSPSVVDIMAAAVFAIAVAHTFATRRFERLAKLQPAHAGLWHLLGEVEVVFGFWAMVLLLLVAIQAGPHEALGHLESRSFTEPAFVFVIMVIAASRPILDVRPATTSPRSRSGRCSARSLPSRRQ
jgi:hypothetical protein